MCPDHIHMLVEIPPKVAVSSFMGYLKGKNSLMIYEKSPELRYKYRNREFWCRGYYVDTAGKNANKIAEYIKHQMDEDKAGEHCPSMKDVYKRQRFEKGLDPEGTMDALLRACELIEMLGCGEVVDGVIDEKGNMQPAPRVPFDPEGINRFLGTDIPESRMKEILLSLGFTLDGNEVVSPSYRIDTVSYTHLRDSSRPPALQSPVRIHGCLFRNGKAGPERY